MARVAERNSRADLESCAREPVHLIGQIQSHGLLLALSEPDFIVQQVSVNTEALLGIAPDAVLGRSIELVLGPRQFELFRARLRAGELTAEKPLRVSLGKRALKMNCVAHRHDGMRIVEFEVVNGAHTLDPAELSANIQTLLARMEGAADILDYCEAAAGEIQRLSGFDRVMIYRFDADWNGEIIAEVGHVAEPVDPTHIAYLGLRFPATDIPAQARQLFLANPLRAIADLESAPVSIVPQISPLTGRVLDLTHTFLRSPSAVHVEYLRNMGVRASLSISIIVGRQLWGLVACHHHTPRPIDCSTRAVCEMIASNLALQVSLRNASSARDFQRRSRELLADFGERLEASDAPPDAGSLAAAGLLELLDADGLISCIDGVVASRGSTVSPGSVLTVIGKLKALASRGIASSDTLQALDERAESYRGDVSGALYVGLNERSGDYLLFLRRELVETVSWAGNPDKSVHPDADGRLHPRSSFAAWQETVRGRSRPWNENEVDSARSLRLEVRHVQDVRRLRALERGPDLPASPGSSPR